MESGATLPLIDFRRCVPSVPVLVLVVVVRVAGAEGAHLALLLPLRDHLVAPGLQRLDRRAPHHRDLGAAQDRRFCIKEREHLENVQDGIKNLVFCPHL